MKKFVFAAIGLAIFASPSAAEHLYSNGQPPHGLQGYGAEPQHPDARSYVPAPDARTVVPQGFDYAVRDRRGPRTGLKRPYGGHGVPYRTPPQGWPNPPL